MHFTSIPTVQTSTRFTRNRGMEGWVDLGGWTGTAFQFIWDKLKLPGNYEQLKWLLKTFLLRCWDYSALRVTDELHSLKFSHLLTFLLTLCCDCQGDEDSIPLHIMLLLMDEVFDLKSRNQWLRRRIVAILQQIAKTMFGDSINRSAKFRIFLFCLMHFYQRLKSLRHV